MHDTVYSRELLISTRANGYRDVLASIDLSTFRRIPWEDNVPFFLISYLDPNTKEPIPVCPRGVISKVVKKAQSKGWEPVAGCEYEVNIVLSKRLPQLKWISSPSTSNLKVNYCSDIKRAI